MSAVLVFFTFLQQMCVKNMSKSLTCLIPAHHEGPEHHSTKQYTYNIEEASCKSEEASHNFEEASHNFEEASYNL